MYNIETLKEHNRTYDFNHRLTQKDVDMANSHILVIESTRTETKGGEASSDELYDILAEHPKAQANKHYKDRIRAVIQEYPQDFRPCGRGRYQLAYKVA